MKKTFSMRVGKMETHGIFILILFCTALPVFVCSSCATNQGYFYSATEAVRKGDYDLAIKEYTLIIKTHEFSENIEKAYYERAGVYIKKGDYKRAIADYTEYISLNPGSKAGYVHRAEAYSKKGDYERAIADYTKYISLNPGSKDGYVRRAGAFLESSQPEKARDDYNEALKIDPNDIDVKADLSFIYVPAAAYKAFSAGYDAIKDVRFGPGLDKGIEYFTEAVRLAPDYSSAYNARGVCYLWKEMYDKAEADFKEALRVAPDEVNKIFPYSNLATVYRKRNELDQALDFVNKKSPPQSGGVFEDCCSKSFIKQQLIDMPYPLSLFHILELYLFNRPRGAGY